MSSYREAGVDLEGKRALVMRLAAIARGAAGESGRVLEGVGGFAGAFALADAIRGIEDPVLLAGADGVGTKLKLLAALGHHRAAGTDCVAMCVNDVVAAGGQPLFFLDYLAMGRLDHAVAAEVVEGIAEGCRQAGCALLGGETAEMPGFYGQGEYELAGFCVGVAAGATARGTRRARPGDLLVGLASSGPHSNGFALIRRIVAEAGAAADLSSPPPWLARLPESRGLDAPALGESPRLAERAMPAEGPTLGAVLAEPTRIYARAVLGLSAAVEVHALAHITGGGLPDNLARVLPRGSRAMLDAGAWTVPPVFRWLQEAGEVEDEEAWRVFNMGIGMVAAVGRADADAALALLRAAGQQAWVIGHVEGPGLDPASTPARGLRFAPSAKRPEAGGWVEIVTT